MLSFVHNDSPICRATVAIVLITFATACTSMRTIPVTDSSGIAAHLSIGDKVQATQSDGRVTEFIVSDITDVGIGGDGEFVAYDDIQSLKFAKAAYTDNDQNTIWIVVALVAVLLVAFGNGPQEIQGY